MNPTVPVAGVCMGGWAAATATGAEAGNANRNTYIHTYIHTHIHVSGVLWNLIKDLSRGASLA